MTYYGRSDDGSTRFRTGYMDRALYDLEGVIRSARKDLKDVDFDTLVGTGFSGGVVIPALARSMKKKFALLRKETDDSHHGSGRLLGEIGHRWIFVDDFISSGRTRRRLMEKVEAALVVEDATSLLIGDYLYAQNANRWQPKEEPVLVGQDAAEERERQAEIEAAKARVAALEDCQIKDDTISVGEITINTSVALGAGWKDVGFTRDDFSLKGIL